MASPEAEAIAKRLERAFAYDQWDSFWSHLKELYDQGVRDGGAVPAGAEVPSLPAETPPPPLKVRPAPAAAASKCAGCGGTGEATISIPPTPGSPVLQPRTVLGPCPDCAGTGGGVPSRAQPDPDTRTFTSGAETVRGEVPAAPEAAVMLRALPPVVAAAASNGRYALVGDAVVDKQAKAVAYRGADAATIYEALRAS